MIRLFVPKADQTKKQLNIVQKFSKYSGSTAFFTYFISLYLQISEIDDFLSSMALQPARQKKSSQTA